jgi:hypothetical protein
MLYNESKHNILASVGKANKNGIILYNESKHNILALVGSPTKMVSTLVARTLPVW